MRRYLLVTLLFLIVGIAPFIGNATLDIGDIVTAGTLSHQIFFELRLPRMLMAFMTGATLALSGLLFQVLFRNVLMTPYTLGVSSGAILGAGIGIKLGIGTLFFGIGAITFFGFLGALFTVVLLLWLSRYLQHNQSSSFLLLGIALSFFYTAALMILYYLSSVVESHMLLRFTMGSLSIIGYSYPLLVTLTSLLLLIILHVKRHELHLLSLNEEQAQLKGLNTQKLRLQLLIIASIGVGVLVSLTGPIGFVGLVVPHIVRTLYRRNITQLILPTFFMGGLFLVACDAIARGVSFTSEIPIGIITSLIGGPFFIYLIIKK
jgi:iron complex transport system permease protein